MTTQHTPINFYAGDDWEIRATLLDESGTPYNLATAEIEWALVDRNHKRIINGTDVTVTVTDAAAGTCSIIVPATSTTALITGDYMDVLRITAGGVTSTLSTGKVRVTLDVFK